MKLKSILGLFLSLSLILMLALSSIAAPSVSRNVIDGKISISGTMPNAANKSVAVQIIPADCDIDSLTNIVDVISTVVYWAQTSTDSEGNYSLNDIKIPQGGEMILRLMPSSKDASIESCAFTSYSDLEISDSWSVFQGSLTNAEIEAKLDKAFKVLEINADLSRYKAKLASELASKESFGVLSDASLSLAKQFVSDSLDKFQNQSALLAKIAAAKHGSEVYNIVASDANAVLLGVDGYLKRYTTLTSTTSIDSALAGKSFADAAAFADRFLELLLAAENPGTANPPPPVVNPNAGGTGGGGMGGGGGSLGGAGVVIPQMPNEGLPQIPNNGNTTFTDINDVPWALEAIEELYKKGLISGRSADSFVPNDNITREELVKLVVVALGLESSSAKLDFNDAEPSAWYYSYLTAAVENGLVSGYNNEYFGIGEHISREDVAVILDRALSYLDIDKSQGTVFFDDETDFSSYSKEAIYNLGAKGIINGDGTGRFNPKGNATRAEAACMLYRFLNVK